VSNVVNTRGDRLGDRSGDRTGDRSGDQLAIGERRLDCSN